MPLPCPYHAPTMPRPCPDHAPTISTMPLPCPDHALTMPRPCPDHAPTTAGALLAVLGAHPAVSLAPPAVSVVHPAEKLKLDAFTRAPSRSAVNGRVLRERSPRHRIMREKRSAASIHARETFRGVDSRTKKRSAASVRARETVRGIDSRAINCPRHRFTREKREMVRWKAIPEGTLVILRATHGREAAEAGLGSWWNSSDCVEGVESCVECLIQGGHCGCVRWSFLHCVRAASNYRCAGAAEIVHRRCPHDGALVGPGPGARARVAAPPSGCVGPAGARSDLAASGALSRRRRVRPVRGGSGCDFAGHGRAAVPSVHGAPRPPAARAGTSGARGVPPGGRAGPRAGPSAWTSGRPGVRPAPPPSGRREARRRRPGAALRGVASVRYACRLPQRPSGPCLGRRAAGPVSYPFGRCGRSPSPSCPASARPRLPPRPGHLAAVCWRHRPPGPPLPQRCPRGAAADRPPARSARLPSAAASAQGVAHPSPPRPAPPPARRTPTSPRLARAAPTSSSLICVRWPGRPPRRVGWRVSPSVGPVPCQPQPARLGRRRAQLAGAASPPPPVGRAGPPPCAA